MVWWAILLMTQCLWGLIGASAVRSGLDRIEKCRTQCSQGLLCKTKPDYMFPPPCQNLPEGFNTTSVFHNISLSTVMRCEAKQRCSLHLRIKTALQLAESIHGVSICTVSAGMMSKCQIISFTKASRERMSGLQVEVENDCTDVSPSQQVEVTVKTLPSYCGMIWTDTYQVPGCSSDDLRKHIPECITGHLSYVVNPEKKELSVDVSDMLEDHDYRLRLCHKDFICVGTGIDTLIKKEQPVKSAILSYANPLPCLCIEGWSAVMDAPRAQVCPFKHNIDELWTGITFDPLAETLIWEPACPVTAVASLCQKREDGACIELPGSSTNVSRKKIMFTKVDQHSDLCVKFTAGSDSWTSCPFADRRLQAWEVIAPTRGTQDKVKLSSQITASFSVGLCVKSATSDECRVTETSSLHVEKNKVVDLNLENKPCDVCVQVKRLDVEFAATVTHCLHQCSEFPRSRSFITHQKPGDLTWVVALAGVCLSAIIIITLVLHVLLTVYQKMQHRENLCSSQRDIDPDLKCVVSALQTRPMLHGEVLVPDSPQFGNNEKANLISN